MNEGNQISHHLDVNVCMICKCHKKQNMQTSYQNILLPRQHSIKQLAMYCITSSGIGTCLAILIHIHVCELFRCTGCAIGIVCKGLWPKNIVSIHMRYKEHNLLMYSTHIWSYKIKYDYSMTERVV